MGKTGRKFLQEALRRIQNADRLGNTQLDLRGLWLVTVPQRLSSLTTLKELDLSENRLTEIPGWLSELSELTSLKVSTNRIKTIPNSIGNLRKLNHLDISKNLVDAIPDFISRLSELKFLDFSHNRIAKIPDSISRLTKLAELLLTRNQIRTIPESISRLSEMKLLSISSNLITAIPESIGNLKNLKVLALQNNQITIIPESISQLAKLEVVGLGNNRITVIPDAVTQLLDLQVLYLSNNRITNIPNSISKLAKLEELDLSDNQIADIPASISRLKCASTLKVLGNPLPDELMAAAKRGGDALLRYIESTRTDAEHPRTVKLVLLGEPQAGKTTLLEALKGNPTPCDPDRKETLGINVEIVDKQCPGDSEVLHLSVWDFAGQHMEHATHQPFLTENAIFLILWDARLGSGAGKRDLWYWLELLTLRIKAPKYLLVATHAGRTPADLNLTEIRRSYVGFQGSFSIELSDLAGFGALETKILELAGDSPALKAVWPLDWLHVRNEIRRIGPDRPYMPSLEFARLLESEGVRDAKRQKDLAEQLHQLGEILYYQDRELLSGSVILRPAWLSELIARVVHSVVARENRGVLRREDLDELWRDVNLNSEIREHLVRLMDHFDLTYSTVDADDTRIVVEALPYSTPEELERIKLPKNQPEMEMIFRFPMINRHLPPGIPTWGIARAHRLARPGLGPWRDAAFFEDLDTRSGALILASDTAKEVRLKVKADYPPFFVGQIKAILMATFKRYEQLVPEVRLPCPCRPGCPYSFEYDVVVGRRNDKKITVSCGKSGADVLIESLLTGYSPTTSAGRLAEESERRQAFTTMLTAMNEQLEKRCPSVFTLVPSTDFKQLPTFWESFTGDEELDLSLYCEHDSGWHTIPQSVYRFVPEKAWIEKLKAHWTPLVAVSLHVAPLLRAVGWAAELISLHAIGEAVEGLHGGGHSAISPLANEVGRQEKPRPVDIETRDLLKELMDYLDARRPLGPRYGGLHPHIIEDGRLLWLCAEHFKAHRMK